MVLTEGWQGLTIEGIAARARVGKQTIYRWWPSKGAVLFEAVMADGFVWPGFPETDDLLADLKAATRNLVSEYSQPSFDSLMRALLAGAQEDRELSRRLDAYLTEGPARATVGRIKKAGSQSESGIPIDVDPGAFADLVLGAVFRRWLLGTGELDYEFADAVAEMAARVAAAA